MRTVMRMGDTSVTCKEAGNYDVMTTEFLGRASNIHRLLVISLSPAASERETKEIERAESHS